MPTTRTGASVWHKDRLSRSRQAVADLSDCLHSGVNRHHFAIWCKRFGGALVLFRCHQSAMGKENWKKPNQ